MISVITTPAGKVPLRQIHATARRKQRGLKEKHLIRNPYTWTWKTRWTRATIDPLWSQVKVP
jgi:hypothetical protein